MMMMMKQKKSRRRHSVVNHTVNGQGRHAVDSIINNAVPSSSMDIHMRQDMLHSIGSISTRVFRAGCREGEQRSWPHVSLQYDLPPNNMGTYTHTPYSAVYLCMISSNLAKFSATKSVAWPLRRLSFL